MSFDDRGELCPDLLGSRLQRFVGIEATAIRGLKLLLSHPELGGSSSAPTRRENEGELTRMGEGKSLLCRENTPSSHQPLNTYTRQSVEMTHQAIR